MFVTCSTKFTQLLREFRTASDEHTSPGNEAIPASSDLCTFYSQTLYLRLFAMNSFKTTAE